MKCYNGYNVENSTVLKSLSDYCGTNQTLRDTIIGMVTNGYNEKGEYIPSDSFAKWFNDNYKSELSFNSNNPIVLRNAIVRYYKETVPSVNDGIRNDKAKSIVSIYGYSSASGREDGKKVIASIMLKGHVDSLFRLDSESPKGMQDRLYRSMIIALRIVNESKLSAEDKKRIKSTIKSSTSEESIRAQLNSVGLKSNFNVYGKNVEYYKMMAKSGISTELVNRIQLQTGEDDNTIKDRINNEKLKYIEDSLGGENISINDQNLIALYREFVLKKYVNESGNIIYEDTYKSLSKEDRSSYKEDTSYLDELMLNSKLEFLRNDRTDSLNDEKEKEAVDAVSDEEGNDKLDTEVPDDDDVDVTIAMYDHSGTYTSAMIHVNKDMKAYLDSIPVLNSGEFVSGNPDYNLDNALGMPVTMDSNKCATVLYHYCDVSSCDNFVESIKQIADSLPGFAGFYNLYKFLKEDKTSAFAFYTVFGKQLVQKAQIKEEKGIRSLEITNLKSNKIDALRQEYFNSIRSSIPRQDIEYNSQLVSELKTFVSNNTKYIDKNPNGTLALKAISKLATIIKHYYTSIDEESISNYVKKNKSVDGTVKASSNLNNILTVINNTIEESAKSQKAYNDMLKAMSKAHAYNEAAQQKADEMWEAGIPVKTPEKIDVESIYTKDYITPKQKEYAINLSDMLVDYSLVKVESNSLNPLNNQSSDVINSSFITGMMQVLKNRVILGKYGTFKFQSNQYNFSNILLEHIDKTGNTIYGLFRKEGNTVVPTEYAQELLTVALYNGAKNFDEDKGITYSGHSEGDYIVSLFTAYRNSGKKSKKGINFGGYLMRTPSDAPKNFIIYAPKYSIDNLFTIENNDIVKSRRDQILSKITSKLYTDSNFTNVANKKPIATKRVDTFTKHLLEDKLNISLPKHIIDEYEDGKDYTFKFQYSSNDSEKDQNIYLVKGTLENGHLVNGELVGVYNNDMSIDAKDALDIYIEKQLDKENIIKRKLNGNHVIVSQLKNMFRQELLDMAVAIDKFFVTENGLIKRENNEIKWKDGISHNGREIDGAYDNYHHKKGVIVEGKIGNERLVGNVFHSNKFQVFDEKIKNNRNYGEELINELFNPLYGGADGNYLHTVKDENGNVVDISLTDEQEQAIESKLEEYIEALINDANKRLSSFENIVGSDILTRNNITDFVLNYQIAYNNFDDLFEGSSKFYKNSQTFLKRAKEVQGSGVPYGLSNFANAFSLNREVVASPLASTKFYGKHTVKQYNKFVGVTVVNTVKADKNTLKTIVDKLVKTGVSEKRAEQLMSGFGYNNKANETTVNDAQSYITFDEWIRRITARGQLNKYKPLINKILKGEELVGSELSEFIQVQKNFYYDQYFDTKSKIFAPRQIKNAEFVLLPQLVKGTQLEVVAKLMDNYGIDQLNTEETSKAGKTNILSIFDEKTGKVHQDIIDEINGGKLSDFGKNVNEVGRGKQLYGYEFLYTQQETPQHMDAENKAGIQIMKKIIDNINPENKTLYKYKENFIKCYTANIKESAKNLFKELNVEIDKNGNPKLEYNEKEEIVIKGLKYSVFYDKLKSELFRLGYDSNMIDYVTLDAIQPDENGNVTLMPNYMSMFGQKLESMAQSIFNNSITRQKLPGFHAAQITNVGFTSLKNTKNKVSYSNKLRYHVDKNGNYEDYVEIMLPASAFRFKRRNADGTLKPKGIIEENGKPTPGSLLEELYDAKLQDIIGYRIPTEGKQSISKMRVVGFLDDAYGSTIVVPDEWVAQTGSDFDIDSVYGIQHSTYIDENGKIQKHIYFDDIYPEENSREGRNNEILDNMLNILSDDKSLEEIMSRSNCDDITNSIDAIFKKGGNISIISERRKKRSVYNVLDQADYQEDVMSGAKLKGFSVSRDNFCSVCNAVHPEISDNYSVQVLYSTDIISYEEAIKRFGKENVDKVGTDKIKITHNRIGWSLDNKNVVGKILTAYSSQTTAQILDAVKTGSVPNVNDFTFGVYKTFPDLGIDYTTTVSFMMQSGVKRIVDAYNNGKSIFINDYNRPIEQAIRSIAKDLGYTFDYWDSIDKIISAINRDHKESIKRILGIDEISLNPKDATDMYFDSDKLIKQLTFPVEGYDGVIFDLGVIMQYNKLKYLADEIGNFAKICNPDKFGAKQTIFSTNKVFDDIKELVDEDRPNIITVDGENFLTAIYPDIDKGLDGYISSENNDSKYPVLHTFLKYSTAPSIVINRMLFRTQSEDFRNFVENLESFLSNGSKLNETQYKSFEKYIISDLYNSCDCLTLPITYNRNARKNVFVSPVTDDMKYEDIELIRKEERARIFGYRTTPEPTMIIKKDDDTEEVVPFNIENLTNPSKEDIDNFSRLTPAQKVVFIQETFRDAGIFNSFSVNLFNVKDISGKKSGAQTIEFVEDTVSKEDAYLQITDAFTNRNPLIALTAYDLVKYAFIVEGYKMTKRGISKIIPNSLLYNDFGVTGTGLVSELNSKFISLENKLREEDYTIHNDYVRSHYKSLNIPFKRVTKNKSKLELKSNSNGIILIPDISENETLLTKYKICYKRGVKGDLYNNSFVRLQFDEEERLYKIVPTMRGYILYPLNILEENEHGEYSSNSANKKWLTQKQYENIITEFNNNTELDFDSNGINIIANNYKVEKRKTSTDKNNSKETIDFDMDNPSKNDIGMVDHIKKESQEFYKHNSNRYKTMFIRDINLEKHIKKYGIDNGLYKYLDVNKIQDGIEITETIPVVIYKLSANVLKYSIQPYLGKGSTKQIAEGHKMFTYIIERLRSEGVTDVVEVKNGNTQSINNIFAIEPQDSVRSSRLTEGRNVTTTDVAGDIFKSVNRIIVADNADDETIKIKQHWRDKGITAKKESIEENILDVIRNGSEYITKRVESIINQLKYFIEDPKGDGYLGVNHPGVMEEIYNNPKLRNRFLKLIEEAEAIVSNNMSILELDIKSQDSDLQTYLEKIKSKLQELQNNNIISEAQTNFANQYLDKYSTNPLIKRDLLNVLNGFYSTSWFNSWFGDLQETPNSMLQIISKEVTSDLFAKEKLAQERVKEFDRKQKDLENKAKAAGLSINWKHIVGDDGKFVQNFTSSLLDDMEMLVQKVSTARDNYNNGVGDYKTYLEAKFEYDKWKLNHINREIDDDYYKRKLALEEAMLYGTKPTKEEIALGVDPAGNSGYPEVYVVYKELEAKRSEIYSHTVNGYLDPYYLEQLDKITKQIDNLIDDYYVNPLTGSVEYIREEYNDLYNPLTGTEEEKRIKRIYSGPFQRALNKYIKAMSELNEEYFVKEAEFGFDEELAKNIHIITSYEKRDANGNITTPMNLLMEHPEYVAAKEWISHNTKFVMNDDKRDELNKAFEKLRKKGTEINLKIITEKHNAKDIHGVIDARSFTDSEINEIKREQIGDQGFHEGNSFSDRTLIKNSSASTVIYKRDFYAGLNTKGADNAEWFKKVNEINSILERYWDNDTKTIRFDLIPDTKEGRDIYSKLEKLYDDLATIKKKKGADKESVKKVMDFRDKNVDTTLTEEEQAEFDKQETLALAKGKLYYSYWVKANKMVIDDVAVPNPYIYGSLHPKKEVEEEWIDKEKTDAVNLINKTYIATPTEYYYKKVDEISKSGKEAFTKWYYENHIWNPSTRSYEPIRCWTEFTYRDTSNKQGDYVPRWINTRRNVKSDKINKDYVSGVGHAMNYKTGTGYDNPLIKEQNEFEKEFKTYIQDLLYSLVHTDSGLRYLNKGYLPSQRKFDDDTIKTVGKEFLKTLGWTTYHNGKESFHDDIGYDTDKTINMPFLALLNQRKPKDIGLVKPIKNENESDEDFAKREEKYKSDLAKLKEENEKAHKNAIDNNWSEVIKSFITQASKFNAIQDNKYMLFYGKRMLEKIETYVTKYGGTSDFKKYSLNSTDDNPEYRSKKEEHLIKQYENWVRRLVYDEWKESRNKLTKWASRLQSLTSAQYMMMNIRGGIANVTLGESQIIAEAFAKEYFGTKSWAKGTALWNSSIISQCARMESDTSISLADAIIKWFNVVDYDENVGKSRMAETPTMKGFNRFNKAMYSPQTIGENFMQNSAMFAMLYDHHVYIEADPVTGEEKVVFKNINEAIRDADINALKSVLSEELKAKLDKTIEDTKADANKLKDYAWYKRDFINAFAESLDKEQQKAYAEARKILTKTAKEEFDKLPSMMSELELGKDGYMGFKSGSILERFNKISGNNEITDTLKALADFRGRVISVNKKIHGVYDKLGQAQIEKKWYGSLVMQYHKHIYPGMLKRWRVKGMYNEQRGTIEKGSYISLIQFLGTPIRKMKQAKNLSEGEINALEGIQSMFKEILNFAINIKLHWNMLPDYEKANIRRNIGDLIGVVSAILFVMALRSIDDDDKEESILYNLALYEADRLASESFQFNPLGIASEAKKLWSTPIAAQSGLEDLISTMGFISDWLFDNEFDPYYKTGRFAGQNKFVVRLKRRIPIYRGINTGLFEIKESNHYYKMGSNMLNSKLVENAIDIVTGEEE